jgi:hypothetical protein
MKPRPKPANINPAQKSLPFFAFICLSRDRLFGAAFCHNRKTV